MNDYDDYDDDYHHQHDVADEPPMLPTDGAAAQQQQQQQQPEVDFDDPAVAVLPRILLMGPRRGGKTSIQVTHV